MNRNNVDDIFEKMTQSKHDQLCLDEKYKKTLDQESDRIGMRRIEEAMIVDDWMTLYEFSKYIGNEILLIFSKQQS